MDRLSFVEDHKALYGVKRVVPGAAGVTLGLLPVAEGGRGQADEQLAVQVRRIRAGYDGTYGSPRVTAELRAAGIVVDHKRVERVMREHGIAGLRLREKVRTTVPEPDAAPVPAGPGSDHDVAGRSGGQPSQGPGLGGTPAAARQGRAGQVRQIIAVRAAGTVSQVRRKKTSGPWTPPAATLAHRGFSGSIPVVPEG